MKINKKILIPVFATAMGLSVIGGISGAVAWYQFNTKVEASWVGASVADGGSLLISKDNGTTWDRSIVFDQDVELHPVTFTGFNGTDVPANAKKHPEYGQTNMADWKAAVEGTDYYQYTFLLKAQHINQTTNKYEGIAAQVKITDFILTAVESTKADAAAAMRINFSSTAGNKTFATAGVTTTTEGKLDLNGDEKADYKAGYAWTEDFGEELVYAEGNGSYTATALAADAEFLQIPAEGLEITMTIWMEGWHSYSSTDMSMWDPEATGGATIRFGVTFGVEESLFITD